MTTRTLLPRRKAGAGRGFPVSSPRGLLAGLILLALTLPLAGCAASLERVQPWERGELAGDLMRPDLNPMGERDWDHIHFSKEASRGGLSSGGGGCGCN